MIQLDFFFKKTRVALANLRSNVCKNHIEIGAFVIQLWLSEVHDF